MFILYVLVGAIALAAILAFVYGLGWAVGFFIPDFVEEEHLLRGLLGLLGLAVLSLVLWVTSALGAGVIGIFTGTGN